MGLKGAAVLVTGASSGIGEATALAFASRRARLCLCARRLDRLQAVAEGCRAAGAVEVVTRKADVGRPAEARGFVATALQHFDRIDVLVNNAGFGWRGRLSDMPEDQVQALVDTNIKGVIWTTQAALPHMLEANSGVIINVASVVGFRAVPYSAVYSASKHAVVGLSHALRGELSGTGVKVSAVYPGTTATEFFRGEEPGGLISHSPGWVARAIVRTARWPRRDVIIAPYRLVQLAEPVAGGLLDHVLGEARRRQNPRLRETPTSS
ncbi:MAG: oxidoreductase [Candidatus Nephthysia bennettiae]|uniref:SDR family NAD(P)-dependent oxidoreductase n=1 Tax=Candidatus Nephthysia bennettiae TaxID=3127016 RepID=A0A934K1B4_9BACT|nr:SDR family NAD(P)-dependent oxidoreductase [Candidatus Dormibacteraeota bacterium]MBJ7611517.1 SDR family NAD(P)-dependent oxidoreductase [Candidatus Dormibacteraeota bacterium]PZR99303.1 MAG: oxidoreductase [Candidatus Dormibacteraeota bacterium]